MLVQTKSWALRFVLVSVEQLFLQREIALTVCVAVKSHDCLVFAADSASTLSGVDADGKPQVLNVYNNADKVFNLCRGLPIAAMTTGMGHIEGRSIASLAKEFRHFLSKPSESGFDPESYTVQGVSELAQDFFKGKYDAFALKSPTDYLEFWIGGYGASNDHAEVWKVLISDGKVQDLLQVNEEAAPSGIWWGGQGEAISRLIHGIDSRIINKLVAAGIDETKAVTSFQASRTLLETQLHHETMPIIDTVNLAKFLVRTTTDFFSFKFGSDIVGGAADVAAVTKFEGFRWIERKHFYPAALNSRETGHVC